MQLLQTPIVATVCVKVGLVDLHKKCFPLAVLWFMKPTGATHVD